MNLYWTQGVYGRGKRGPPSSRIQGLFTTNKMHFLQASILENTLCAKRRGCREGEESLGLITGFSLIQNPVAAAAEGRGTDACLLPADSETDPYME